MKKRVQILNIASYNLLSFKLINNKILMELIENRLLEERLNEQIEDFMIPASDKIYFKAFSYLTKINSISIFFKITIMLMIHHFIVQSMPFHLFIFLNFLIVSFLMQLSYLFAIKNCLSNHQIYYSGAKITGHLKMVPNHLIATQIRQTKQIYVEIINFQNPQQTIQNQRQQYKLASIIYELIAHSSNHIQTVRMLQFIFHQIMHVWALLLIFFHQFQDRYVKFFIIFILICSFYQYNKLYISIFFISILLPYILVIKVSRAIRQQYKKYKLAKLLKTEPFSNQTKGDKECYICLTKYEKDDPIVVLKCAQTHHFHDTCFKQWMKMALTCPLCRKDISTF